MIEKSFPASTEALNDVLGFCEEIMEAQGFSGKSILSVSLCIEEAFVNVASYAYPDRSGEATLRIETNGRTILLELIDSGIAFNPLERAEPDTALTAEEREIGGLGIFLVRKTMDTVTYERKNNQNILTMKKSF